MAFNWNGSRIAATRQPTLLGVGGEVVDQIGHQATPSGLVASADASPIVAVEVLIKQQIIFPVGVALKGLLATKDRP